MDTRTEITNSCLTLHWHKQRESVTAGVHANVRSDI